MKPRLRIATRRSALALWQANHVSNLLSGHHPGLDIELLPMVTRGDRILDQALAEIGGKGLFLKELEQAMLEGQADLAVHSMKDMPAEATAGLEMEVVLTRATPYDAWLSRSGDGVDTLPAGSSVGTSSLRRQCQLLALRPDLEVLILRGNVDTRLRKLEEGQYDAIILACAGLERLGLQQHITDVLAAPAWLPAATQGIIGLQCREDDEATRALIAPLADADAMLQAKAERTVARMLEGSCQVPLAAFAELDTRSISLSALVGSPDGKRIIRAEASAVRNEAVSAGEAAANDLIERGAFEIIHSITA